MYCDCAKLCSSTVKNFVTMVESGIVDSDNLGTFYRYVNKRLKHSSTISAVKDKSGILVVSDGDKANVFNQYFSSVSVIDNGILPGCSKFMFDCSRFYRIH